MIAYLPTIYPDELVYSWFCRYYIYSGCLTHKMVMQELYCDGSDNPSKEFIGNLNSEARDAISRMYPLDMLILNHTMFPQYARFIPMEQRERARKCIGQSSCDVHHLFAVLPRTGEEQYLRYCPLCAAEDRKEYGETYWHRKHQIRNMGVCTRHGCRLETTHVAAKSEQSYTFFPAETAIPDKPAILVHDPEKIRFASYLESVFDAPLDFETSIPVSAILYHGMGRTKYLTPSGRSRYTQMLAEDMQVFYERLGLCSIASVYQIQRVLLGRRFDFSVVCQISFFLGMEAKELTGTLLTTEQIRKEQDTHCRKGTASVDWKTLDMEMAPLLEQVAKGIYDGSVNENGRPERVSERMVYREMGLRGHQLDHMTNCKAVFERYKESYPESWARKLVWAYWRLKGQREVFYWSDIRKMSGVKKKNFDITIPFLQKYANPGLLDQIYCIFYIQNDID